jgi:hypothetical protein
MWMQPDLQLKQYCLLCKGLTVTIAVVDILLFYSSHMRALRSLKPLQ